ncbi:STAS domain-containing protein [Streptomyces sp. DSM 41972]|uniref:Anti-sigma factor antagonist n=1 Tax=Streptomyces althioticus subsp. attaecolombicae TaxID=3075534 RepID=A0ABU3I0F2_9ACTN|nr:STAS domain-containing protein [Streptomyces sp. DSM 41972]SCD63930.1 anti-anti-sigma factor [Streptomyces sp. di188]SCD74184.1 anti-anti-sigma factor [Streptomyces sp. di50b]
MRFEPPPLTRHLRVRRDRGGHTVLEFHGEIGIAAAAEIGPYLDPATADPDARVVVDPTHITFFDLSGLRLLHHARHRLTGGRLQLVCVHPLTLRMLRITGLTRLLPPWSTLDSALTAPRSRSGPA